jgi:hypothetical protein
MIYIIILILMAIAAWIGYEMNNFPIDDDETKTPK